MSQSGILAVKDANLPTDVATSYDGNTGVAIPLNHVLNVVGSGSTTVTALGNTLTISASTSAFTWNVVTSANNPVTLVPNNGYISKGIGVVNFILPAAASIGDLYWIKGIANLWTLSQNALQNISLGYVTTTAGVGGSISANQVKDSIEILCVTANSGFEVLTSVGNPTIV